MNRRDSVVALIALGGLPFALKAQQTTKVWRIGYLSMVAPTDGNGPLRRGLQELGYVEGRNITIDRRFASGKADLLSALAADLVRQKVDVIVAASTQATIAARNATSTIPIVMEVSGDAVGTGLVKSLAHPGGNITGNTMISPEVAGKRMELIKEVIPKLKRVAVLWNPADPPRQLEFRETTTSAQQLGIPVLSVEASEIADVQRKIPALVNERADALIILIDPFTWSHRALIADLALSARIPTMGADGFTAKAGVLMSYGPNLAELVRHTATYVDKILKGAKPADLPVEQPTQFELFINLKTAKALGVTIPQSVLVRADEVIQ